MREFSKLFHLALHVTDMEKSVAFYERLGCEKVFSLNLPDGRVWLTYVRVTELQDALELVFQNDVFTQAEVTALEIYTYPMRLIKRFDLTRA